MEILCKSSLKKKKSVAISKNMCNLKPIRDLLSGNVGLFLVKTTRNTDKIYTKSS